MSIKYTVILCTIISIFGCRTQKTEILHNKHDSLLVDKIDSSVELDPISDTDTTIEDSGYRNIKLYFADNPVNEQEVLTITSNCAIFVLPEVSEYHDVKDSATAQSNSFEEAEIEYRKSMAKENLDSLHIMTIENKKRYIRLKGTKDWLFDTHKEAMVYRNFILLFVVNKPPQIHSFTDFYDKSVASYFGLKQYSRLSAFISERIIPESFKRAFAFLELIKASYDSSSGEITFDSLRYDEVQFSKYISKNGVYIYDPDRNATGNYSIESIIQQIKTKNSNVYKSIEHLSYYYSTPYKQYSKLIFLHDDDDEYIVLVASNYKLTFKMESNQLKLIKLECMVVEGC